MWLDRELGRDRTYPEYWRVTANLFREEFMASLRKPAFLWPVEFSHVGEDGAEGLRATQTFLAQFAELLRIWPQVWERARGLSAELLQTD